MDVDHNYKGEDITQYVLSMIVPSDEPKINESNSKPLSDTANRRYIGKGTVDPRTPAFMDFRFGTIDEFNANDVIFDIYEHYGYHENSANNKYELIADGFDGARYGDGSIYISPRHYHNVKIINT